MPFCSDTSNCLILQLFDANDGATLLHKLQTCVSAESTLSVLSAVHGPWAMVYYQVGTQILG